MTLQVAFYRGRTRVYDRVTQWWLKGKYSHCELILGTDLQGLSICASSSAKDGGVRIKHMQLNPERWDIISVDGDVYDAWHWMAAHADEGYDYLGFVGFIFRALGHDKPRWFCSEAVAAMLGIPDGWRFDPCSLHAALSRECFDTPRVVTP